ncbi:MAG: hypothetical protein FWH11_00445 [Micrococcales bacterium]|nr:hypothetical protein [Micrococcales bacterium]
MTRNRPQFLTTDDDLLAFVGRTMDHALRDQTWLWLTDPDSTGFGTVVQLDHSEADGIVPERLWQAVAEAAGTELGLVYERRGPETLSTLDHQRLRAALHGAAERGLRLRGPILVHDTGTRWLGPDDLAG